MFRWFTKNQHELGKYCVIIVMYANRPLKTYALQNVMLALYFDPYIYEGGCVCICVSAHSSSLRPACSPTCSLTCGRRGRAKLTWLINITHSLKGLSLGFIIDHQ